MWPHYILWPHYIFSNDFANFIKCSTLDGQLSDPTDTIHRLPDSIQPHKAAIKENADHIFFFSGQLHLSNFHIKKFKIDGEVCVFIEQYIQSQKAKLAKCYNVAKPVLETVVPAEMKRLCKALPGLNPTIWETEAPEIVRRCIQTKFQDPELRNWLQSYCWSIPHDKNWRIGYPIHYRNLKPKKNEWGQNMMGKLLMQVRSNLQ